MICYTHKAFISMNMACKNNINPGLEEQVFHGSFHFNGFRLALMSSVGVVPRGVNEHHNPGSVFPVNLFQVSLKPFVLRRRGVKWGVGAKHDDMNAASHIERIEEVRVWSTFFKGHVPSGVVCCEWLFVNERNPLHFVVTLGDHPRTLAG